MSDYENKADQHLAEAEKLCSRLKRDLPTKVDVYELNVISKGPLKALVLRGGLLWRTEEFGRNACRAFRDNDRATGIILTRAVIENVAVFWRLNRLLDQRAVLATDALHGGLEQLLVGWKSDPEFPRAINILTLIGDVEKEISGIRHVYDQLSEVAHPNYGGVHGLFADTDHENFITHFGRDIRGQTVAHAALGILEATLGLTFVADGRFASSVVAWLFELPPMDEARPQFITNAITKPSDARF